MSETDTGSEKPPTQNIPEPEALIDAFWFDGAGNAESVAWSDLDEQVDDLEEGVVTAESNELRFTLGAIRR
jgi:hypothetical protein